VRGYYWGCRPEALHQRPPQHHCANQALHVPTHELVFVSHNFLAGRQERHLQRRPRAVTMRKALVDRPKTFVDWRSGDKARDLTGAGGPTSIKGHQPEVLQEEHVPEVRPASRATRQRSSTGGHMSPPDRSRIKCSEV
jgi:hypothetical protein